MTHIWYTLLIPERRFIVPTVRYGFTKPDDKPIHTEEVNVISDVEICSPGRFSFKMSEPWDRIAQTENMLFGLPSDTEKGSDRMILVRDIFQAKFGKGGELVALFQEARRQGLSTYGERILTDASGPFYTVVIETTIDSLAEWERRIADIFSQPEFGVWFARMTPLVESGRREFYNVEG